MHQGPATYDPRLLHWILKKVVIRVESDSMCTGATKGFNPFGLTWGMNRTGHAGGHSCSALQTKRRDPAVDRNYRWKIALLWHYSPRGTQGPRALVVLLFPSLNECEALRIVGRACWLWMKQTLTSVLEACGSVKAFASLSHLGSPSYDRH